MLCGKTSTSDLTDDEWEAVRQHKYIQDALPNRSPEFREQVISGTHPACWDAAFGEDEE
jgi:hypothetical protein